MDAVSPTDFNEGIDRLAAESFNEGVETICESIMDTFRRIALCDPAVPRTFTAADVIRILKPVKAGAMLMLAAVPPCGKEVKGGN